MPDLNEQNIGCIVLIIVIIFWLFHTTGEPQSEDDNTEISLRVPANRIFPGTPLSGVHNTPKRWFWWSKKRFFLRKHWKSNIPMSRLAREILYYTGPILSRKGIKYYPELTIRYYRSKSRMGEYNSTNRIVIYLKNHTTISEFADTVLHEICHHIQNAHNGQEFKKYTIYNESFGYWDNPLEVESRRFAKEQLVDCLEYLYERKYIVYVKS